jgi:large subunit ribosomal protein L22
MATVTAQLNNLRQAPRKVRLVVGLLKGKNALKALEQLEFVIRRPSLPIAKLLRSAIANAEHNYSMVASNLFIKEMYVDEGVKLKRFRPKAMGAVGEIQKKTSHIRLTLAEKVPGLKSEGKAKVEHTHDHAGHDHSHDEQPKMTKGEKPEIKTELGKKVNESTNTKRRTFQRKSI